MPLPGIQSNDGVLENEFVALPFSEMVTFVVISVFSSAKTNLPDSLRPLLPRASKLFALGCSTTCELIEATPSCKRLC